MPLFQAIGLGVTIIVLKVLTPEIFSTLESLVLQALTVAHVMLAAVALIGTSFVAQ